MPPPFVKLVRECLTRFAGGIRLSHRITVAKSEQGQVRLIGTKLSVFRLSLCLLFVLAICLSALRPVNAAEVFIYSSQSAIRGIDLTQGTDRPLTTSPFATGVNGLAYNLQAGIIYYGDQTSVYRWNPAMGSGPAAHILMNDFSVGPLVAPITNINSTAGSFLNGKYYVGSEAANGYIEDMYELTMSLDGTQVVSVQPLNLLGACNCSSVQIGGFGDVAAILEGGVPVLYGSSADLSGSGQGTSAGRWKFTPSTNTFQFLSAGSGGQMSASPSGTLYSNVGNAIREVNKTTGAISSTTLLTTSASIYDFTGGFALDYGDAPDSYGSAFHRLAQVSTARLGTLAPDNEAGSLNAVSAAVNGSGDDNDGIDDEDAVNTLVSLSTSSASYTLSVACSAGARVAGWIDSNINGVFDNNERNANHPVSCNAGQATLTWTGLLTATAGNTYMRLRASTNASAVSRPTGIASDGEVEDHAVQITGGGPTGSTSCPAGSSSSVYTATDVPLSIGPNANTTTVSTINVIDTGSIVDVNLLDVTGTHTYINDLWFDLRHDNLTRRLYGPSCGSQNNFSFGFDDSSSGTPPCPPTDGNSYPPTQSLGGFIGQDSSGDWELRIRDRYNGDAGSLTSWTMEICTSGAAVVEIPDLVVGKAASVSDSDVTFRFVLANTGNVELTAVSLVDDLDATFGAGNYTVMAPPVIVSAPAGITANSTFNGSSQQQLLAGSAALPINEQIMIDVTVRVDQIVSIGGSVAGVYSNQATASAISPASAVVSDLSGNDLDIAVDSDDPTVFQIDTSVLVSGAVFIDVSPAIADSHDGLRQASETGVEGRIVRALDASDAVIATTSTDANGQWQLLVDPSVLNQAVRIRVQPDTASNFVSESSAYAGTSISDGELELTLTYGEDIDDVNTGVVPQPGFILDDNRIVTPGTQVTYAHRYTSSTHGQLTVPFTHDTTPGNGSWTAQVFNDANCNTTLDASESPFSGVLNLQPGDQVCLLMITDVPLNSLDGHLARTRLLASFVLADDNATGHGVVFQSVNEDVTTVIRPGAGRLELVKSVRNVTLGGTETTANSALPGHTLEYAIEYINAGDGPLTELLIDDAAPPFTQIQSASVSCDITPASLTCTPGVSGASVSWTYTGSLAAGQGGRVSYSVVVD